MQNEKVASRAYDGWKDLHTWSNADTYNWAKPETIIDEVSTLNDLPKVLTPKGINFSAMMLVTSLTNALGKNIELGKPLAEHIDSQVKAAVQIESKLGEQPSLLRDWLWNLRQLGTKGVPEEYGVRDLTDFEVYQYRLALQVAGVHPLKYHNGESFMKVLEVYTPESQKPHDLMVKFYEREAFVNTLTDPALARASRSSSLYEAVQSVDSVICKLLKDDLPMRNVGLRSQAEDNVVLVMAGGEKTRIEVTPPDKVEAALEQVNLMNNEWLRSGSENMTSSAKKHFLMVWNALKVIQPLKELNTRVGFIVAAHITEPYLNRELPDAFTGNDFGVKSGEFLYENRDPVTLVPSLANLERMAEERRSNPWVNKSTFVREIRERGFIVGNREWESKMKWRE